MIAAKKSLYCVALHKVVAEIPPGAEQKIEEGRRPQRPRNPIGSLRSKLSFFSFAFDPAVAG
jgi:hypothetical protein